eukprot:TRINITY_DN7639_c0_g1_i3.p1 TRINITY_DN7639_c0_g1~~TRINITY_DN7639_c0_g1_i3.p1  ORF type:complete len:542 (-),score=73.29 TRINITY_DN7639_c0_g1_i3:1368-2993(-)
MGAEDPEEDLNPIQPEDRTWTTRSYARFWIMLSCNPASMAMGGNLLEIGLDGLGAVLLVASVGFLILLFALAANAVAGTRYGIPFPVVARVAFGWRGVQLATMSRGAVAIMWLSYQMWAGAQAIYFGFLVPFPGMGDAPQINTHLNLAQLILFICYGATHALIVHVGVWKVHSALPFVAPTLSLFFGAMLVWACVSVPLNQIERTSHTLAEHSDWSTSRTVVIGVVSVISGWSTMSLNITDFSRFAGSQRAQFLGQAIGLPLPGVTVLMIGAIVASASQYKYGEPHSDMISILGEWPAVPAVASGLLIAAAIVCTNVTANLVSPANDIKNIAPERIGFRTGAYLSLVLAMAMQPWLIFAGSNNFIVKFLGGYAIVTGSILGIMAVDYFWVRAGHIDMEDAYLTDSHSRYHYWCGVNPVAVVALLLGTSICMPGFCSVLATDTHRNDFWGYLFDGSWFVSLFVSSATYWVGMRLCRSTSGVKAALGTHVSDRSPWAESLRSSEGEWLSEGQPTVPPSVLSRSLKPLDLSSTKSPREVQALSV